MEFTIEKSAFEKALALPARITKGRTTLPVLSMVRLSARGFTLTIAATDLEITYSESVPADIKAEGEILVESARLLSIIKAMPDGPVVISSDKEYKVTIKSGKTKHKISGLDVADYPKLPEGEGTITEMPAANLRDILASVEFCADMSASKFSLATVCIEKSGARAVAVSTDGHHCAWHEFDFPGEINDNILIPINGVRELISMLDGTLAGNDVGIAFSPNMAFFISDDKSMALRLVTGKYVKWRQIIIPNNDITMRIPIDTELLRAHLRRIMIGKTEIINMTFKNNLCQLSSEEQNGNTAETEFDCEYTEKDAFTICINPNLLTPFLGGGKIKFIIKDNLNPIRIETEGNPDYNGVIMPVRPGKKAEKEEEAEEGEKNE
jgi:DNA polymerase-3 subunit beta